MTTRSAFTPQMLFPLCYHGCMTVHTPSPTLHETTVGVRRVLWIVLILNALVAAAKLITGLLTGTVSMVADGFHSSVDASSNVIGLVGIQLAAQPPDADHPYGHRRFETLATLAIGGMMLVAAWEILKTSLERALNGGEPAITPVNFAVMIGTMLLNLLVTFYERRAGRRYHSDILLADASHTASDFFVSLSVLASLAATSLGFPWMDIVVALFIVVVIVRIGLSIIGQTSNTLADRQMLDPEAVSAAVAGVPGVEQTVRIRSRGTSDAILVDVDARIKPATTTDHAYSIGRAIKERIREQFPNVEEVQVHFAPQRNQPRDYMLEARAVADALGLSVHEVIPIAVPEGVALEMHVEVMPGLTLGEAHRQVSELERRLETDLPTVREVITHIEPANIHGAPVVNTQAAIELRDQAVAIANQLYPAANWHHVAIRLALGGYAMTMHCHLPPMTSVEEAHDTAEHVETAIRTALPLIQRVTIHTEPVPDPTV